MKLSLDMNADSQKILKCILYSKRSLDYIVEILNEDSMHVIGVLNWLEKKGYIAKEGETNMASLTYNLTEKANEIIELTDDEKRFVSYGLTMNELKYLAAIRKHEGKSFVQDENDLNISASYLQEAGYLLVKGIFVSTVSATDSAIEILDKEGISC